MTAKSAEEAVANGRAVKTYDVGMCQKFVRSPCWEVGSLYGSAIDAWHGAAEKHPGDRNPPNGAPCYYSGGAYGHAVISVGGGRIRSTDCQSATYVNDAALDWPERQWGYSYLGWTGDINGVDLPLEGDEDMNLTDENLRDIARYVWAHKIGADEVGAGTIMVRIDPGSEGLLYEVAQAVWLKESTQKSSGEVVSLMNILRAAEGYAARAADK